jgi:hypothetical protein
MVRPTVDDKNHEELQRTVAAYLDELNYLVDAGPYHESMRDDTRKRLQEVFTPTSLYIRGRSDRIAVHEKVPLCLMWECKTNAGRYRNAAIEALPLAYHVKLGVRVLYIYWDVVTDFQGAFWVKQLPPISRIKIPDRWNGELVQSFKEEFAIAFPDVGIDCGGRTSGSGDPFVLIREEHVRHMLDWRKELDDLTQNAVNRHRN